jgi:hypothetical protein
MKKLKKGDRIRLNVYTISGWKGLGTVTEDQVDDTVTFRRDGEDPESWFSGRSCAMRHEVSVVRGRG